MKIHIDIEYDNKAFRPDPRPEIGRILTSWLESGQQIGALTDANGAHVGRAWITGKYVVNPKN